MREKEKMLREDGIGANPKGKVTDPAMEKDPKTEGEAFQVAFYHLVWKLIFLGVCPHSTITTPDHEQLKAGVMRICLCVLRRQHTSDILDAASQSVCSAYYAPFKNNR